LENAPQGSAAWLAARSKHFCASEAAAALGMSKYSTRDELLRQKATGLTEEVSPAKQRIFDAGHEAEALARPIAEGIAGTEFFPVVATREVDGLPLLASFDGIDVLDDLIWENKLLNQSLVQQVQAGDLEPHYWLQLEHQLLVSGASRALFTTSDGTPGGTHPLWYESKPERRAQLIAGWKQFAADLAAYVPQEAATPVVATPTESLPTVVVQVQGALTVAGNLPAFGDALRAFIARIPQRPGTDQEFADADAACKALKKAEDALAQAEDSALAQIGDVELMRRTVADLKTLARNTRLATEKLVKAEKDARRAEKVMNARTAYQEHVMRLQQDCSGVVLDVQMPDFATAIKGLSSLASIDDKLTAALIDGKAKANTVAGRIVNNLKAIASVPQYAFLFPDRQELAHKDAEVLELLMHKRVTDHQAAEQQRQEAERERIRQEEAARADREARAKLEAEQQAVLIVEPKSTMAEECARPAENAANVPLIRGEVGVVDAGLRIVSTPAPSARTGPPTLRIGTIKERLQHMSVTAEDLRALGFEPAGRERAAPLYHDDDFPAICDAIAAQALEAKAQFLRDLAVVAA
ncbi:MAG TPA: YqaJ viral recombinase family protein, partial [Comamonas denitrificans]|nr:YqaJ viral recombinase family protein [Comamonas denitrificans]